MGQEPTRSVPFLLPEPGPEIELNSLRAIFRRGGAAEFIAPQRLEFDLLYRVTSGSTIHRVDFIEHRLQRGDMLRVRAGQVHHWGDISHLEGAIALFPVHIIDVDAEAAPSRFLAQQPSSWSAAELEASGASAAWESLFAPEPSTMPPARRSLVRRAALSALLLRLDFTAVGETVPSPPDSRDETFRWFQAEVDARFRTTHRVSDYAARLGYSTKSIGRAARRYGTTPKQVIDARIVLESKRHLVFSTRSIAELATELGFDDASNFSSFFLHRVGMTPKQFRDSSL